MKSIARLAVLVVLLGTTLLLRHNFAAKSAAKMDTFCQRLMAKPNSRDAKQWFDAAPAGAVRTLGELDTTEESRAELQKAYEAGAIQVFAIDIAQYPENNAENTGKLVVELPQEPAARKRVLNWCAGWAERTGHDAEKDVGQRYVFVMMD